MFLALLRLYVIEAWCYGVMVLHFRLFLRQVYMHNEVTVAGDTHEQKD